MNVLSCSINTLKGLYDISGVEVGQHFYWKIGDFQVHGQVLITSWVVIAILLGSAAIAVRNPQIIPTGGQNFFEYVLEFIRDVSKTQIGEEYGPWVPFIGTMFLFIFVSNWSGALLPWKIIELPHGELAACFGFTHVSGVFLCGSYQKGIRYRYIFDGNNIRVPSSIESNKRETEVGKDKYTCNSESSSRYSGGHRSGRVDKPCPILTKVGPNPVNTSLSSMARKRLF
ncbi:hypothetical protein RJ640_020630 [Escallonia rubra]|uniref:ATP synthase CF0 A chain n=1 Tax=Escallonia rubra TaxID=112253 RepID=A0AA88RN03_9ASTE|nr:hypothetical protein RJ640_020630 [Escallonia rubra]